MKDTKTVYAATYEIDGKLNREYELFRNRKVTLESSDEGNERTKDFGCQFDKNTICTCKRIRRKEIRYYTSSRQVYRSQRYSSARGFTDIGVGNVKTLPKRRVKRIYLPETVDTGVGSADLTPILSKAKNWGGSYYEQKKTSSKCIGGVMDCTNISVVSEKLSPIIQTTSRSNSPKNTSIENIPNDSILANNELSCKTEDIQTSPLNNVKSKKKKEVIATFTEVVLNNKVNCKITNEKLTASVNKSKSNINKSNIDDKDFSSDSLIQHVHNLENPSDYKQSKISIDFIENKLEREYRKIFSTKPKERKPTDDKTVSDFKSASTLRRRFEALRRGISKKDEAKTESVTVKASSQNSVPSKKDVSIVSDPPSLEARSYSNTKFSPVPSAISPIKKNKDISHAKTSAKKSLTAKKVLSPNWSTDIVDSECQGVKGMFKLWGQKFNLDEDNYDKVSPLYSGNISKERGKKKDIVIPREEVMVKEKKEGKRFSFFRKRGKDKSKQLYKSRKGVTAGRCEVDGLMIKIGAANEYPPKPPRKKSHRTPEEYNDILRKAWLKRFLSTKVDSKHSAQIRWNNNMYTTSSSTVFELIDCVYKNTGLIFRSKSEMTTEESSYYQSFTNPQVNFLHQSIQAWMIPKTTPDNQLVLLNTKKENKNIEVRYSNQKWFIEKSKAFARKIEVVLHSKNFEKKDDGNSSDYIMIDIPEGYFSDSSSNVEDLSHTSDEQVYNIVEYETVNSSSYLRKCKKDNKMETGDHASNEIQVTVSVKDSRNNESNILETVIKRPPLQRDVVVQGSNVYIPKRCDVIGVGIITQRDIRDIKKPILKIQDELTDDSEHILPPQKKCEFAESYLQDYYRNWTPLGIDLFSWCISDSHLRGSSENNSLNSLNQGDGSKSCPNIYDDYQASTIISSCNTSSCSHCLNFDNEKKEKADDQKKQKLFGKFKKKTDPPNLGSDTKRILPKDSIEVFRRRKIYALSNKAVWATMDDTLEPCCVPSTDDKCEQKFESCRVPSIYDKCAQKLEPCCVPSTDDKCAQKLEPCCVPSTDDKCAQKLEPCCVPSTDDKCAQKLEPCCVPSTDDKCAQKLEPCCVPSTDDKCAQKLEPCCVPSTDDKCAQKLEPCCVPSIDNKCGQKSSHECRLSFLPLCIPQGKPKKRCKKHVSMQNCDTMNEILKKQLSDKCIEGILSFKGVGGCEGIKKIETPNKRARVILQPTCEIPQPPCIDSCTTKRKPACSKKNSPSCHKPPPPVCPVGPPSPCQDACPPIAPPCTRGTPCTPYTPPCPITPCPLSKPSPPASQSSSLSCCEAPRSHPKQTPPRIHSPPTREPSQRPCECPPKKSPCNSPECPVEKWSSTSNTHRPSIKYKPCKHSPLNLVPLRSPPPEESCFPPPPPCVPPSKPPCSPHCTPACAPNSQTKGSETKCQNCPSQEFPWPLKRQTSNTPSRESGISLEKSPKTCPEKKTSYSISAGIRGLIKKLSVSSIKDCKPDCANRSKVPKCLPTKPKEKKVPRSRSKAPGLYLKMIPVPKCPSKECLSMGDDNEGIIRLNSKERITIKLKKATDSTEEIREGCNMRVEDDDGQTLYERRDYKRYDNKRHLVKDMYRNSQILRVATSNADILEDNISENNISESIPNILEINLCLKFKQGDKPKSNLNNYNEKQKDIQEMTDVQHESSREVYIVQDQPKPLNTKTDKKDLDIKIVIKNYRQQSIKSQQFDKHCVNISADENFSTKISEKFHTVSTGYSDVLEQKTFSIHRTTTDLTNSNETYRAEGNPSNETVTEQFIKNDPSNNMQSEGIVLKTSTTINTMSSMIIAHLKNEDEISLSSKTNSIVEVKVNSEKTDETNDERSETGLSTTDNEDGIMSDAKHESNDIILPKIRKKEEKKAVLEKIFENADKIKKKGAKSKMQNIRKMLRAVLTSDSSAHEDIAVNNELANELTYASLKPNYFKNSESMTNYYFYDSATSIKDSHADLEEMLYPTGDNNSECSAESSKIKYGTCLCSEFAAKLNIKQNKNGCCCRSDKRDKEIVCNIIDENCYKCKTEHVDVETQDSKYFEKCKPNVTNQSVIINEEELDHGVTKPKSNKLKIFSPFSSSIKACQMKRINRSTVLGLSKDDKVIILNSNTELSFTKLLKTKRMREADILQSQETKKAVLEIYAEKTISNRGERIVAKLPKFVYNKESEIRHYQEILTGRSTRNIVMMSITQ